MSRRFAKRAQSTLEYAVIVVVVVVTLIVMMVYVRRAMQGRFKETADDLGRQFSYNATGVINVTSYSQVFENTTQGNVSSTIEHQYQNRTENLTFPNATESAEWWPE